MRERARAMPALTSRAILISRERRFDSLITGRHPIVAIALHRPPIDAPHSRSHGDGVPRWQPALRPTPLELLLSLGELVLGPVHCAPRSVEVAPQPAITASTAFVARALVRIALEARDADIISIQVRGDGHVRDVHVDPDATSRVLLGRTGPARLHRRRHVRTGQHHQVRFVAPAPAHSRISTANEIDLVPLRRIAEMVVEERLVRRSRRQTHRQDEASVCESAEHDHQRPRVLPPCVRFDRLQSVRLHEVAAAARICLAMTRERSVQSKRLPLALDRM